MHQEEYYWRDPRGSFLAAKNSDSVYKLFGEVGLCDDDMPPYDWDQYLNFAGRHFKNE